MDSNPRDILRRLLVFKTSSFDQLGHMPAKPSHNLLITSFPLFRQLTVSAIVPLGQDFPVILVRPLDLIVGQASPLSFRLLAHSFLMDLGFSSSDQQRQSLIPN